MLIEQVTWDVVARPTPNIDKPMPSDLVSKVGRESVAGLKLEFQCFQSELRTAGYFEVRQEQLPATNYPLSISFMPSVDELKQ